MQHETGVASRSFGGDLNNVEHFISVDGAEGGSFAEQLRHLEQRYLAAQEALRLPPDSAVFRRVFVSDVMNQAGAVYASSLYANPAEGPVAVSIVQQPPLRGAKIALLAYHLTGDASIVKRRLSPRHVVIEKSGLKHLWSTRLCAGVDGAPTAAADQTREVFGDLIDTLARAGGSLREHCVRTWIYLKDVDVFYQDMVESRRELFQRHGLTANTHYIASTGIEGACAHRYDLVAMDAYSILGLAPEQMSYLNDLDHLCPTKNYGVTFERGTRIAYADRAHHFISGTASIDSTGAVLHRGDVLRQLGRALDNVDALLHAGQATLGDMMHLTVYLRDPADFTAVDGYLAERFSGLPMHIVHGAVCRPEWLIEVEGIAAAENNASGLPAF
jgi:enamine deaminase RidA (YjgF/YER057c/UK114 family)